MASSLNVSLPPVLTLESLDSWKSHGPSLAVLGFPIKHSISPEMHNAALEELAKSRPAYASWKYFRFEVVPDRLPEALTRLREAGFQGMNLTVPHKIMAVDLMSEIDPAARPIGAVNTLLRTASGWKGFNTDGYGMATGMRETLQADIENADIVVIGAGGAGRGAAVECLQRRCASLTIVNRTASNTEALLKIVSPLANGCALRGIEPREAARTIKPGSWIINATSAGLKKSDPLPLNLEEVPAPAGVYDMIYNPAETALLAQARALGIKTANGLSMLVHQGARALEIWTGEKAPVAVMQLAAARALNL